MKQIILIVLFLLLLTQCKAEKKNTIITLEDSLFVDKYKEKGYSTEIIKLISKIGQIRNVAAKNSLLRFAEESELYFQYALKGLVEMNTNEISNWLSKYHSKMVASDWLTMLEPYKTSARAFTWHNDTFFNFIITNGIQHTDPRVKCTVYDVIATAGSFADVKRIYENFNVNKEVDCPAALITAFCRYNDSMTNTLIINFIKNDDIVFDELKYVFEFGVKEFNRYDLLPYIKILKGKQKNANQNIEIDSICSYLEQKKAENAPIGLPLNWSEGNAQK